VFARSNAGIVDSNPTQGMDVYVRLFCVCIVLCVGSGLATGWSPVQGVLPTVYRIKKLKKRPRSNKRTVDMYVYNARLFMCHVTVCAVSFSRHSSFQVLTQAAALWSILCLLKDEP
jgi:hypothetical protein